MPILDTDDLRRLFATPPPDFVAARNELAKRLRRDGDKESATTVASIRRPAWTDWALDVTSAGQAKDVEAYAAAAGAVREAQAAAIEGRDGPDIRDALKELRDRTAALVAAANAALREQGRDDETPALLGRLSEIAGNPGAVEQLRQGLLGSDDGATADLFAGLEPAPAGARPKPTKPARPAKRAERTAAEPKVKPAESPEPSAEPKVTAIERRRLQRELDAAEKVVQRARRTKRETEAEAAGAGDAVAAAERTLALATKRLDKAQTASEAADADVHAAEQARDAAAAALDDAGP